MEGQDDLIRSARRGKRIVLAVTAPLSVNLLIRPVLDGLCAAGWQVHIVCAPGQIDPEVTRLATVEFIPMERSVSPGRDAGVTLRMARLLGRVRPEVLVGGTPKAAMIAMAAGRLARIPVRVFQVRGARWDGMEGRFGRVLLAADRMTSINATDVLSVSDSLADLMVSRGACKERPTVLGAGGSKGVDTSVFSPADSYHFNPEAPRIGFVGRLSRDKGIDDVLSVYDAVQKAYPGASMSVIGEPDQAQPIPPATLSELTAKPSISWVPRMAPEGVADAMRRMDVLLFPSIREGLPNVVIEAAACGVPTVGWDTTGVRDAVLHGETGYLVPICDRAALAGAVSRALEPERHEDLRQGALQFARSEFSSERVQTAFVEYLDSLTDASLR